MKKIFLILSIFSFFLFPSYSQATTYTVCAAGCDETTIQAVFDNNDLAPGDDIQVKAGTYTEQVAPGADDFGTSGNEITLTRFGTDSVIIDGGAGNSFGLYMAEANDYFIISYLTLVTGTIGAVRLNGADNVTFSNVTVQGSAVRGNTGIKVGTDDCNPSINTVIEDSILHGFQSGSGEAVYHGADNDDCTGGLANTGFIFRRNIVYDSIEGIDIKYGSDSFTIEDSIFSNLTSRAIVTEPFNSAGTHGIIRRNLIHDITGNAAFGGGIFVYGNYTDIYANVIYDVSAGILISGSQNAGQGENDCGDNNYVYNNSVYKINASKTGGNEIYGVALVVNSGAENASNNTISNNIFATDDEILVFFRGDSAATNSNTCTYNEIYRSSGAGDTIIDDAGSTYTRSTVANFDANSLSSDPLYTTTTDGSEDLTLQAGSPCRSVGEDLGASLEYCLDPASSWTASVTPVDPDTFGESGWPIGAFEFEPIVTITALDSEGSETGPDTATFRIARAGSTSGNLVVNFTLGGTAGAGDYDEDLSGGTGTILDGNSTLDITITPTDDSDVEGQETLTMTIAADSYAIGSPSQATIYIADNESVEGEAGLVVFGVGGTGGLTKDLAGSGNLVRQ